MPQYTLTIHPTAKTTLADLNTETRERVTDTLQDVASTRQPTEHSKCELLESHTGEKAYRVRVGDIRVICELDKPEFRILKLGRRENVYAGVDGIHAVL